MSVFPMEILSELVFDAQSGFASGKRDENGIAQIRMNNVTINGELDLASIRRVPRNTNKNLKKYYLNHHDVLFNSTNSPNLVGKSTLFIDQGEPFVFSNHFIRIRTDTKKLDPNYFARWLTLQQQRGLFELLCTRWVNQASVRKEDLLAQKIPLPPLPEQKRIAAILDKADELRQMRRRSIQRLDDLLQSVFLEMFGDPNIPNNQNHYEQLTNFVEIIMGQSPPGSSYNNHGDGIPLLNGPTEFGKKHPVEKQWTTEPKRMSQAGDILFCVRGATAGRLNVTDKEYCIGRGIAAIRMLPGLEHYQNYIYRVLDFYYPFFQAKGVGSTFINISRSDLSEVRIPFSSDKKIEEFLKIQSNVATIRKIGEFSLSRVNLLFYSLQQRAFKGEL